MKSSSSSSSSSPSCARQWEAEAAIDGRLSDADKASFERHVGTCQVCQTEVRELEQLREVSARLGERDRDHDGGGGQVEVSELEHRRHRAEILRLANNDLVLDTRPTTRMFGISIPFGRIFAAITFACVAVAIVLVVQRPAVPNNTAVPSPPTFRMTTNDPWQRLESEAGQTVHVHAGASGHFELEVDKLKAGQRFLVDLPDGELEVQGTRFEINLADGHTKSVHVFEGKVALRLRGEEARTLNANDAWDRPAIVVAPPSSSSPPPSSSPSSSPVPLASVTNVLPPPPSATGSSPAAGSDLASAMQAFTSGDYARAETLFAAFAKTHPSDARAEDAAFLIAVSREKRGDHDGARTAAQEYLRRYPTGFRRKEAERMASQ